MELRFSLHDFSSYYHKGFQTMIENTMERSDRMASVTLSFPIRLTRMDLRMNCPKEVSDLHILMVVEHSGDYHSLRTKTTKRDLFKRRGDEPERKYMAETASQSSRAQFLHTYLFARVHVR